MSIVAFVLTDIIHIVSMLLFCDLFFGFKRPENTNNIPKVFVSSFVLVGLSISVYFVDNLVLETVVYTFVICILISYFYKEQIKASLIAGIWIVVIMGMLDTMAIVLFEMVDRIIGYNNDEVSRFCGAVILCLFIFIFGKMYKKKYKIGIKNLGKGNLFALTTLTTIDTFIVMVIGFITTLEKRLTDQIVFFVAFILVILGLFLQLGAVILIMVQRNIYKESQQLTEKYLEEQKNHYEYLEKRETETKKFRHDLRSHMEMLSVLAKEHRYDEFDKYVEEINVNIDSFGNNVSVQNGIVDAIINKYYSEAVANDVSMEVKGRFPSDCKIDAYHLCTIFSNILSNALEATIEAQKKWISVECRYTDDNILVEVKNTFDNKNTARNGKARTHKKDANNHGFGLENVKDSISKYKGLWEIDINEDIYTITISFNYVRQE